MHLALNSKRFDTNFQGFHNFIRSVNTTVNYLYKFRECVKILFILKTPTELHIVL